MRGDGPTAGRALPLTTVRVAAVLVGMRSDNELYRRLRELPAGRLLAEEVPAFDALGSVRSTAGALGAAGIPHVVTGELALALRYPRPGDRPVHGITVVTDRPRRRVSAVLAAAGIPVGRFGRRSLRADVDGLRLLVHRGWPGAPTEPIAADPDPPGHPPFPVATPGAEARRIARPPLDPDGPADRLDLAALSGTLPGLRSPG